MSSDVILLGIFSGITGFFADMGFVLKIFVLIAVVGFLNQHMQNKILKMILFIFMGYFILVKNWSTFGTIWLIYTVLGLGVSGVLVDLFFVSVQGGHDPGEDAPSGGDDHGTLQQGDFPGPNVPGGQGKNPIIKPPMMG